MTAPDTESVITFETPRLLLGPHATAETGRQLRRLGVRSTLLVTEPTVAATGVPDRVRGFLEAAGIEVTVTDGVRVEPTDDSCQDLAAALAGTPVSSLVAVGGGSTIDTAKVLNLLLSHPGVALREYVNRPIGGGRPVPGRLMPLIAVPTTAGSGSECTAMVALEIVEQRVKTGIADRALMPVAAIVDPLNTVTVPPGVTAAGGYDVLTHACESYTTRAFDRRPRTPRPAERPIYIGANPVSDIWAEQALRLLGAYFVRAVRDPGDLAARTAMSQAAVYAGMGFGNAGTHIPHACGYPIAGLVDGYRPRDAVTGHSLVPHGESVVATAPAAFEFTYPACPERHLRAAELLGGSVTGITSRSGADVLSGVIAGMAAATGAPRGLRAFGYRQHDIPALVDGAAKQERLLTGSPRPVDRDDLARIFEASMAV